MRPAAGPEGSVSQTYAGKLVACRELRRRNEAGDIHQRERFGLYVSDKDRALCAVDLGVRFFDDMILASRCVSP